MCILKSLLSLVCVNEIEQSYRTRISASLFEYESSLHFKQTYIMYLLQGAPGPPGPVGVNGEVGFKVVLSLFYQSN